LAHYFKIGVANGIIYNFIGGPRKQVTNGVLPTEYVLYLLSQWNKPGYAIDFFHWHDNSEFHAEVVVNA
jgi:hypothetical protein